MYPTLLSLHLQASFSDPSEKVNRNVFIFQWGHTLIKNNECLEISYDVGTYCNSKY